MKLFVQENIPMADLLIEQNAKKKFARCVNFLRVSYMSFGNKLLNVMFSDKK